jgi:hypothetical protein
MDPEILAAANGVSQALAKLPPVAAVVFRPADLTDAQLARYQPGALIEERGFLSCTRNPARTTHGNTTFAIASVWAKDVSPYSPRPDDAEVVFDRSTAFRVLEQRRDPDTGRTEILLEEVPRDRSAVLGPL